MEPPPSQPRRSWLSHAWLIGVAVYACIIAYIGWTPLRDALASVDTAWLAAMAALMLFSLWLRALKWRWALGPGNNAIGLFFLSKGAGGYSPARLGELAPLMIRRHRTPRMAAWIVLDRLLETGATIGLGIAGCVALGLPRRAMGAIFAAAMIGLVVAPYFILTRRAIFERAATWFRAGSMPQKTCAMVAAVSDELRAFRTRIPVAAAWSVACTALDLAVGLLLYYSFGYAVAFSLLAVAQCAHGLASALPFLPNATGGPYLVAAGLLYQFAGIPEEILAAAVGINVALSNIMFWTSFAAGAASLRHREEQSDHTRHYEEGERSSLDEAIFSEDHQQERHPQRSPLHGGWSRSDRGVYRANTGLPSSSSSPSPSSPGLPKSKIQNPKSKISFSSQSQLFDYLSSGDGLYTYAPDSLARLDALIPQKGRALDIGCGDGAISKALNADAVFAIDISQRCAALARRKGIHAVVADATAGLPFRDGAFDTVYCVDVLHHLTGAWPGVLDEVDRVLRSGGRAALVEPDARYAFVRWTQSPSSPIRVAPYDNEPAIHPDHLMPLLVQRNLDATISPIRIDGSQITRSVFPMWQRIMKAPFVIALAWWHGSRPNKFAIIARKSRS